MEQIPKILSLRNMLVLSLALNFSLVLRILNGDGEGRDSWDRTASVSIWPTTASGSSSLSSASCNYSKIEEDADRIINLKLCGNETAKSFLDHSYDVMSERWKLLKQAAKSSNRFTIPDFVSQRCNFFGKPLHGLSVKKGFWIVRGF